MTQDLSIERSENEFVLVQSDTKIALERGQAVNLARSIQFLALQSAPGQEQSGEPDGAPQVPVERFAVQTDLIGQIVFLRLFASGTEIGYGLRPKGAHELAAQLNDAARKIEGAMKGEVLNGDATR